MVLKMLLLLGASFIGDLPVVPLYYVSADVAVNAPKTPTDVISVFGFEQFLVSNKMMSSRYITANCVSVEESVKQGEYAGDTAQAGQWIEAQLLCNHLKMLQNMKVAKVNHLKDDHFSNFEFFKSLLPSGVSPVSSRTLLEARCTTEYSYCITINDIEEETGYNMGQTFTFTLQYAGDLNGDGAQDYVLYLQQRNLGGNGFWGTQMVVTQKSEKDPIEMLSLDWLNPAGGGN